MSDESKPTAMIRPLPSQKDIDEALAVITDAIAGRITPEVASDAIELVLHQYEAQLRIFMVGVAKARAQRVLKVTDMLRDLEDEMFTRERIKKASTDTLVRMYGIANAVLSQDVDFIRKITDMRAELERLGAAANLDFTLAKVAERATKDVPALTSHQREMVRQILSGVFDEKFKA